MTRIIAFVKHEFLKMLPPTIYFFVVLHIIIFARNVLADEWGIQTASTALATVGALIIGKSILIVDAAPVFSRLARTRLLYDVATRTLSYMLIALVLQFLEEWIPLVLKHQGPATAVEHMGSHVDWPQFWVSHLIMTMFLAFYTTITGVCRLTVHSTVVAALMSPAPVNGEAGQQVRARA